MDNATSQPRWVIIRSKRSGRTSVITAAIRPVDTLEVPLDTGLCEANVTANVTAATSIVDDDVLRLELAKLAYQHHWRTLGYASQLLQAASAAGQPVGGKLNDSETAVRVAHALRAVLARKMEVSGWKWQMASAYVRAAAPACAAVFGPLWLVARYGGSAPRHAQPSQSPAVWHAVHGERETRTRHLLPPDYTPHPSTVYLILGRPRERLDAVRQTIDPSGALAQVELLRPLSVAACLRSLPRAASSVARLLAAISRCPVAVGRRDAAAIAFRLVQGAAHDKWWARLKTPPDDVIFAHTGTADTTALERAIQHRNGRTHHVAHGVNTGWPFAAISNTATFVCGHDANIARSLPAYRHTRHIPIEPPPLHPGDGRWLLLTAYTHPMGRPYACFGIAPDLDALGHAAEAARRCGVPADKIVWRPHPALAKVPDADRISIERRAATLGFNRWPQEDPLTAIATYSVVITTPSTVLLDALARGKLPVLLTTGPLQSDLLYAAYPLCATNPETLATAVTRTSDSQLFQSAWSAIAPGRWPRQTEDLHAPPNAPA